MHYGDERIALAAAEEGVYRVSRDYFDGLGHVAGHHRDGGDVRCHWDVRPYLTDFLRLSTV